MEENKYYVYLHIKETTGEPFYVGKGKNKRAFEKTKSRSNHWKSIVNKYGYDIIFLEENLNEEDAFKHEIYWIKRIGRKDLGLGPLVNFSDGGEGGSGRIMPQEQKDKISDFFKGNKYSKGRKATQETKDKIKEKLIQFYKDNPDMVELKRKQTTELNRLGITGTKGKPSKKKGIPLSEETKQKMSIHKKEYYKNNKPSNYLIIDEEIKNYIFDKYINGVNQFALHKEYKFSRNVIRRIIKEKENEL